jgi:hypothetical protein
LFRRGSQRKPSLLETLRIAGERFRKLASGPFAVKEVARGESSSNPFHCFGGLPPNFPHARIRRRNFCSPQLSRRTSALFLPILLALSLSDPVPGFSIFGIT